LHSSFKEAIVNTLNAHGLEATLPAGWDGRIYMRSSTAAGDSPNPVLHPSSFPLPPREEVGDYGNGAVQMMGSGDVFQALVEFNPELANEALFRENSGIPRPLGPGCFAQNQMQRRIPGLAGAQFFFNHLGRAFSLYGVIGSAGNPRPLAARLNGVVETLAIGSRS
jgi:hypothetical protein